MTQPSKDPVLGTGRGAAGVRRLGALRQGEMQQSGGGRERRAGGRLGEAGHAQRATHADLFVEN